MITSATELQPGDTVRLNNPVKVVTRQVKGIEERNGMVWVTLTPECIYGCKVGKMPSMIAAVTRNGPISSITWLA